MQKAREIPRKCDITDQDATNIIHLLLEVEHIHKDSLKDSSEYDTVFDELNRDTEILMMEFTTFLKFAKERMKQYTFFRNIRKWV